MVHVPSTNHASDDVNPSSNEIGLVKQNLIELSKFMDRMGVGVSVTEMSDEMVENFLRSYQQLNGNAPHP